MSSFDARVGYKLWFSRVLRHSNFNNTLFQQFSVYWGHPVYGYYSFVIDHIIMQLFTVDQYTQNLNKAYLFINDLIFHVNSTRHVQGLIVHVIVTNFLLVVSVFSQTAVGTFVYKCTQLDTPRIGYTKNKPTKKLTFL